MWIYYDLVYEKNEAFKIESVTLFRNVCTRIFKNVISQFYFYYSETNGK